MAGSSSRSVALPRSLGMVTYLPALQTLQAPSIPWLRGFFADLRPQHRHVGVNSVKHLLFGLYGRWAKVPKYEAANIHSTPWLAIQFSSPGAA